MHLFKGIFDLVTVWEEVCKKVVHAKLIIIGSDGDMKVELEKKVVVSGLANNE
ncbi:MAG: hypothetical protein QXY91_06130 [Thermoproteota archaeon]